MKNEGQINIINKSLQFERDKMLQELNRINIYLSRKIASMKKILSYRDEYTKGNKLKISRSVPALLCNLESFTSRIHSLLREEENEIEKAKGMQRTVIGKIEKLDQKIKLMNGYRAEIKYAAMMEKEKIEQRLSDDLSSLTRFKDNHE